MMSDAARSFPISQWSMLVPNSVRKTISMLIGTISSSKSTGAFRAIRSFQRTVAASTTSVMTPTISVKRRRWKAGDITRRCCCHNCPSLPNSPSPMISSTPRRIGPFQ